MGSLEARLRRLESEPAILAEIAKRKAFDPRWARLDPSEQAAVAHVAIQAGMEEAARILASGDVPTGPRYGADPRVEKVAIEAAERTIERLTKDPRT